MTNFIKWFFSPSKRPIMCYDVDLYDKIVELESRIERLEEENVETTNTLYEVMNSIEAVDTRIDIVAENPWENQFNV
jgi:predicted RNase H-related nuclease YkuK (DUF458 family)